MANPIPGQRIAMNPPPAATESPGEEEASGVPAVFVERVVSYFVSLVFHAALLLILALFVYHQNAADEPRIDAIEARIEPLPEAIRVTDISVEERLNADEDSDSSKAVEDVRQLANASEPPPVTVALSNRGVLPTMMPGDGNGFGGNAQAGLGESAGTGEVAGNGSEEKGTGEVGFFGTKAKGKSFVFIVDCSSSMDTLTLTYNPRQKAPITRFLRARQELYLSLGQLARDQTFYIIFYNHDTFPMYYPQPVQGMAPATTDHLQLARAWIQNVVPRGGTDPREAFQVALALRPDVIFFLTDGAIPPVTQKVARENNTSRTRIHTIAFGLPTNQETLKGIAQENQGRFRFVP